MPQIGSHVDLLPTICKAAGVAVPADRTLDGFDALPMAVSEREVDARCDLLVVERTDWPCAAASGSW